MTTNKDARFGRILDWLEGRLTEEEAREVEERVAADEEARAELEWLRAFVRTSEDVALEAPPERVREVLERRFASWAEERRGPSLVRRIVATLAFDSGAAAPAAGFRSGAAGGNQQLVYDAQVAEIALNVRPRPGNGKMDLYGQIFPAVEEDPETFSVRLLKGPEEVGLATADELGEFAFEAVRPGIYEMVLSAAQIEFHIHPVQVCP